MCDADVSDEPLSYEKAFSEPKRKFDQGMNRLIASFFWMAALVVVWLVILEVFLEPRGTSARVVAVMTAVNLLFVFWMLKGIQKVSSAFCKIYDVGEELRSKYLGAQFTLDQREAFIKLFPVSQEEVDSLLKAAAERMKKAHHSETELLHGGIHWVSLDGESASDPEAFASIVQEWFNEEREKRSKNVKEALADYYSKRDRVRDHGLKAHTSWKDYLVSGVRKVG